MNQIRRSSGVLLHVSSLWGNYSEGSLGAPAREWIDFLAASGFSWWQVLPFCLPDEYNSPYKSYSAFSLNPFFIDLEELHARGLITAAELAAARQTTPYACEFARLADERLPLLARAADRFGEPPEMDAFFASHPRSAEFCRFMALKASNGGRPWQDFTCADPDPDALRLWRFTQYTFFAQWTALRAYAAERGVSIIGDIPIYVADDSADVWASPDLFRLDQTGRPASVAGVPPDYFCEDGQLWGNPLYDWRRMRADGFAWWRERIAFMAELFDGVRIDHFRGFESYFSIPAGETTAKNGRWVKGPGLPLVRALRDAAPETLIIAEDLGVITPEVRALVDASGFPGMRVLQFGFLGDPDSPHLPHNYVRNCVAYTGTHDNNTLLGFVWEQNDATRRTLMDYCGYGGADWNACYDAVLRTMFASHAGLVIVPVQDLLLYGSDTRLNTPGRGEGNWSYRLTRGQLDRLSPDRLRARNTLYARA